MIPSFVDTNILVYAHDTSAGDKHTKAKATLQDCWKKESGFISTQVLQEFYVTVTRKLTKVLPKVKAREIIQDYTAWPVYQPTAEDIISASELEEKYQLSFWDALIVVTAQNSGTRILFSEDLQDGRQIGKIKVVNPFQ